MKTINKTLSRLKMSF